MLREGQIRIPSGCAISGFINKKGKRISGHDIIKSIAIMKERGNGLGGGFAAYGIYPDRKEYYAFHLFFDDIKAKEDTEHFLNMRFETVESEQIPTRKVYSIQNNPIVWRYFLKPLEKKLLESNMSEEDYVVDAVMTINSQIEGAFVFSSGKNMGAFKGVGYPEDIGEFFRIDEYKAYIWTSHSRFPTNTPGWWGGAHPFTLLDWSIVHNGEISSYGTNFRYLEMFGYKCTLRTDTEVMAYLFDLLLRKHNLSVDIVTKALAAPFWSVIERENGEEREKLKAIRAVYQSCLVNGPFSIILGFSNGILALNDRIKLRPLVAAKKGDFVYVASEEAAIREICNDPEKVWSPKGGEAVYATLDEGVIV